MKRPRYRHKPWQETLAIVVIVLLCAALLHWSGLDKVGVPPQ
jgi:hypothetical protein